MICGFPSENEEGFGRTLQLVDEVQPDIVNISKFFPRPHTPAERMKRLDVEKLKNRSRKAKRLVKKLSFNKNRRWLNWRELDDKGTGSSWIGRNFDYKPIVIKADKNLLRRFISAKVVKVSSTYLEAEIISQSSP